MLRFHQFLWESDEITVYHVTPTKNVPSILKTGLQPRIGPRSKAAKEQQPAIYVFPTRDDMMDAEHWIDGVMPDDTTVLRLTIPRAWMLKSPVSWESMVIKPIPPERITVE